MPVRELHQEFLNALNPFFEGWRFVKGDRAFRLDRGRCRWGFHVALVNHTDDFDAVGDVAVEFVRGKERVAIVGAELGNIEGTGQKRFSVASAVQASAAASGLHRAFQEIGLPFLQRFSDPKEVLRVLKTGGEEAMLISPFTQLHAAQIAGLESLL